jgi:D-sedoheptulose 7-phosphate isomerase
MIGNVVIDRDLILQQMRARNDVSTAFFARDARALSELSAKMADCFRRGGRLLAFGGAGAVSDAQHVAVEFVHPVLAGKRALPALDLSADYTNVVPALTGAADIVMGFASPSGDAMVGRTLVEAAERGALCIALPGHTAHYAMAPASADVFVHQEVVEILYHMLWESVHVFLEHDAIGHGGGAASFLYPFLDNDTRPRPDVSAAVAESIRAKAATVAALRNRVATEHAAIAGAVGAVQRSVASGGRVLTFGNGGSATDAGDFAMDLLVSLKGHASVPAISLAGEAATLTALANDIGTESIFVRQLIAHARPGDVAFAISTSGGSRNIVAALLEARQRGLVTVALLGYDGGEIVRRQLADYAVVVQSDQIPRIQEVHATIYHLMADALGASCRQ